MFKFRQPCKHISLRCRRRHLRDKQKDQLESCNEFNKSTGWGGLPLVLPVPGSAVLPPGFLSRGWLCIAHQEVMASGFVLAPQQLQKPGTSVSAKVILWQGKLCAWGSYFSEAQLQSPEVCP